MRPTKYFVGTILSLFIASMVSDGLGQEKGGGRGDKLYSEYCLVCHGEKGWGDGPAAHFLDPRPRDFRRGIFKIRSTPTSPTDEDLFRTITRGIPGTLMPSYEDLTEEERWDLVVYIKSFSEVFEKETPEPIVLPEPPPQTEELLVLGKRLYDEAGCFTCHGPYGRGDGPSAKTLKDSWGNPIPPYDFTVPGRMKSGQTVSDIYRAFFVGIGGTPMPAYGDIFSEEQNWALSYYVLSLAEEVFPELPSGNSITGRDLFTGIAPLENGGSPCIACHSVTGIGTLGGGVMGPDLTRSYNKFDEYGITTVLSSFPFPVMNPLFIESPLTEQEQADLIAFLQQVRDEQPTQAIELMIILLIIGTIILIVSTNIIWRRRLVAVRRPLVEQSALSH